MRWFVRVVGVVVAAALLLLVAATGLSAKDYGTLAFWAAPSHIGYCGRQFDKAHGSTYGTTRYFVQRDTGSTAGVRWQRIGRTFGLRPIYATMLVHPVRGGVCAGTLFVPLAGHGHYVEYELSGGP